MLHCFDLLVYSVIQRARYFRARLVPIPRFLRVDASQRGSRVGAVQSRIAKKRRGHRLAPRPRFHYVEQVPRGYRAGWLLVEVTEEGLADAHGNLQSMGSDLQIMPHHGWASPFGTNLSACFFCSRFIASSAAHARDLRTMPFLVVYVG